ncbi:DUF1028 domain-containing protein [Aureitalea sp. L0-47]|uniref:DUF1028 domain-containing protein n=1 Tax=Aureitalea sp. L0-47 TaxID=2816962 RepID=UPI0022374087|nr:DUF1028 domain-containing protein [Aureitalea sp. L0-47]MCW5518734.1 DUF1028 domain-containing protein [Aureitalea sp. L0-47]
MKKEYFPSVVRPVLTFVLLLTLIGSIHAQHTFSIVAVDPVTGEIGSAGATCLDIDDLNGEEGALVISDIILGIGAIHTQAFWHPVNQAAARDRMLAGDSPQEILDWLFTNDPAPGTNQDRQYGIVDLIGGPGGTPRSAAFTGTNNSSVAYQVVGSNYAIQGNILISQDVIDDMETEFLNATGTLANKLMAAMQGAKRIGADNRCTSNQTSSKSAFLRVAKVSDLYSNYGHLTVDLNVSKTMVAEDPIDVLQNTYDFYLANPGTTCTTTISTYPYEESFESGLGLWEQNDIDLSHIGNTDFDWTENSGTTATNNTGPTAASDGMTYLYTEASGANQGFPTKRAVLNSPCFDLSGLTEAYFEFDYHMFGSNVGNLAVRVNDGTGWNTVWLLEGNQGDSWNVASIDLVDYLGESIQLRVDSTTGLGERSDVAFDNVRVVLDPLSISDVDRNAVSLVPNPAEDLVAIQLQNMNLLEVELFDVHGRMILSETTINESSYTLDVSFLSSGLYFTSLKTTNGTVVKRLIKQ